MLTDVEIVAVGEDQLGIVLPPRVLARLKVGLGDELWIKEIPGGIELSAVSPEDTEQLRVMRKIMRDNREVLKKLADS